MKKILSFVFLIVFMLGSYNFCLAAKFPTSWKKVSSGEFSDDAITYARLTNCGEESEISRDVVLGKGGSVDIIEIFVTIETFDKETKQKNEIIEYHSYVKEGKLIEDPVILTKIQETEFGVEFYSFELLDYGDIFEKECINNTKGLPQNAVKKIKEAFRNKNK